jgi:1-acyl-sn-glycerol-3-phosphate acyltransferase
LSVLGGRVNPIGLDNLQNQPNALLAGNHLSYMDVLCISSVVTSCFVTSVEIKNTPGLGHLCKMAGCLFVERRSRAGLTKEIGELQEGLERGLTVTIFPEATSTNGEQLLRFKRPLFLSAVQAKKPVVPMCLNYRKIGTQPLSLKNRDAIFWYGDMDFLPHLWELSGKGSFEADLHFLTPLLPGVTDDPGELAAQSQVSVESVFRPVGAI